MPAFAPRLCPASLLRLPVLFATLLSLAPLPAAAVADPASIIFPEKERQGTLFGSKPSADFVAPGNLFAVRVPTNWEAHTFPKQPQLVEIRLKKGPGTAQLQIKRLPVSAGAHPKQLLLRALESRLKKLPHFEAGERRELMLNGLHAAAIQGTFWYQGNAEYPRAIEEVYVVVGEEAFEMHFECFAPAFDSLTETLDGIYQSFVAHPSAAQPGPAGEEEDDLANGMDNLPF